MGLEFDPSTIDPVSEYIAKKTSNWPEAKRSLVLIEACFTPPFAPYQLQCKDSDVEATLEDLAGVVGLARSSTKNVRESIESAQKAHKHIAWRKILLLTAAVTAVGAAGGYLIIAPFVGAALGTAAGLTGAAGVSHGLALLGGGALSMGGAGMAGGLWVVTGVGTGVGAVGMSGIPFLLEMGHARATCELVKLQVTFRHIIVTGQIREAITQQVVSKLIEQQGELWQRLNLRTSDS